MAEDTTASDRTDRSNSSNTRGLVTTADRELFTEHDLSTLERNFSADYVEHSPLVADGLAGLRELVTESGEALHHDVVRVLVDGDLVALQGSYPGLAEPLLLGFDVYRVAGGKIVEHWDGLVEEATPNPSGRTQLDGPTEPDGTTDTEASRRLVTGFFEDVLIGQNYDRIPQYTDGDRFHQHASDIADGAANMRDFLIGLKEAGTPLVYDRIHRTVAQNDFVLTHSEGSIDGERHSFCELWRVEDGKVVELWDAIGPVPADADLAHPHGAFRSVADQ